MAGYQNILCATDFSKYAHAALLRGTELANLYGAKLTLLHVVEYFPEDRSNVQIAPENTDPAAYRKQQAHASLTELTQHLGFEEVEQDVRLSTHSAKNEILRYIKEKDIDLIVIASHGHHGITSLLGSTAIGIVHGSSCDVLVVRVDNE